MAHSNKKRTQTARRRKFKADRERRLAEYPALIGKFGPRRMPPMEQNYEDMYPNIREDLREKWIAEQKAWDASMYRIKQIWQILIDIWDIRDTDMGWGVYYSIEELHGVVSETITPELVLGGLIEQFPGEWGKTWVWEKYKAYHER